VYIFLKKNTITNTLPAPDTETGFSRPPEILGFSINDKEPSGIPTTVNDGGGPTIDTYLEEIIGWN
tara:strand:- start:46 stop:243 length:198 start_codon:yes stop_codon:yes gene_type:complete